jgi:hypothetical protein
MRDDLDEKLVSAAEKSGRSVSEEIEHRLQQSFAREDQEADREAVALKAAEAVVSSQRKETERLWKALEDDMRRKMDLPPGAALTSLPGAHSGSVADRIEEQRRLREQQSQNPEENNNDKTS